ncbi:MAG: response regulator [Nitrosomonas sp.]|jgi:chemotaxis family two-component system response regulator Rcp1|uniref:response regulator n=1 Tax=Nitrosomonas sp. TaxID=42353 RepID=UPI001D8824E8|nr:response regulator [Nitrosomonas sp.]MBX9896128.1 response regulator [Nitrosomonas sp.]
MNDQKMNCSNVILIVDDNPTDAMLVREAFACTDGNTEVFVAEDGVCALEFLRKQDPYLQAPRPDIILLDLNMPRKNGIEFLAEMKADIDLRIIPVIVYTSSVTDQDIKAAFQNYANGYIKKSVNFDECIEVAKSIKEFWFSTSILCRS